jgi:thiosulfate reductase cytochrome b subunit
MLILSGLAVFVEEQIGWLELSLGGLVVAQLRS